MNQGSLVSCYSTMKHKVIEILENAHASSELIDYAKNHLSENVSCKFDTFFQHQQQLNPMIKLSLTGRVEEALVQLLTLQQQYKTLGIPISYLHQNLSDLEYRILRHKQTFGEFGLTDSDLRWLTPLYQASIFDLGSLRFQLDLLDYDKLVREGHDYMHISKATKQLYPAKTPIITIHILKGADLHTEKVEQSFLEARYFFKTYFSMHQAQYFVCRSWLLYKPMQAILNKQSNITLFANRFNIIGENNNHIQALERIYGSSDRTLIAKQEKKTSLQRNAYLSLDTLGVGAGIIPF